MLEFEAQHERAIIVDRGALIVQLLIGRSQHEALVGVFQLDRILPQLGRVDVIAEARADAPIVGQAQHGGRQNVLLLGRAGDKRIARCIGVTGAGEQGAIEYLRAQVFALQAEVVFIEARLRDEAEAIGRRDVGTQHVVRAIRLKTTGWIVNRVAFRI